MSPSAMEDPFFFKGGTYVDWMLKGAAVAGVMGLPLGPLGSVIGILLGGGGALLTGWIRHSILYRDLKDEAEAKFKSLVNLLRWTEFVISDSANPALMLIHICMEFKSIIEFKPRKSRTKTQLCESLRELLSREDVQHIATQYQENFFRNWRTASKEDVESFKSVFNACCAIYEADRNVPPVYASMLRLSRIASFTELLDVTDPSFRGRSRNAWMLVADHVRSSDKNIDDKSHIDEGGLTESDPSTPDFDIVEMSRPSRRLSGGVVKEHGFKSSAARRNAPNPWINELNLTPEGLSEEENEFEENGLEENDQHWNEAQSIPAADDAIIPVNERSPSGITPAPAADSPHVETETEDAPLPPPSSATPPYATMPPTVPEIPAVDIPSPPLHPLPVPLVAATATATATVGSIISSRPADQDDHTRPAEGASPPPSSPRHVKPQPSSRRQDKRKKTVRFPVEKSRSHYGDIAKQVRKSEPLPTTTSVKPAEPPAEKRFFKNFDDFKDFDTQLKHKIPVGFYEFDLLSEFVPEYPTGKWGLVINKGTTRVYKQIVNIKGSDIVMVRGYAYFEGISLGHILYNLKDLGRRTAWDKTFDGFTLVEGDILGNEITYNALRAPWPAADRDFLQWRRTRLYPSNKTLASFDGAELESTQECRIFHRSADHPKFPEPTDGKVIRAESIISAYVFTVVKNGRYATTNEAVEPDIGPKANGTRMMLLTQCDIKGVVPKWLVNSQAAKAPGQWIDNFRKACEETTQQYKTHLPAYTPKPLYVNGASLKGANPK